MSPARLRAYVLIVMRDMATPAAGLFLSIFLPLNGLLELWMLPLLAGMIGVPLVAHGGTPEPNPQEGK